MTALIQINNLHYRPASLSSTKPDLLRGISMQIEEGAFVAIIGENGSGKTTLIKHINGLLLPTKGSVIVDDLNTSDPETSRSLRLLVGMVFQNPSDQIVASTVEEDVAFGLENLNLPTHVIQTSVADQLRQVGLTEEATRPPHFLSGGQIQKLALAGVLVRKPKVLLFDEPTSMLDPITRDLFMAQIRQLHQQGMTIIYVTHHMEEAVYADEVIVLNAGQIAFSGSPGEVFGNNYNLYEVGLEKPEAVQLADQLRSLGMHIKPNVLTRDDLLEVLPPYKLGSDRNCSQHAFGKKFPTNKIITIKGIHYTYLAGTPLAKKALYGADLEVSPNRIHGVAGTNGSGKSTLLQHINGILRPERGTVRVAHFKLENQETTLREVIKKVGLVFQNPESQFFEVFVGDEIAYGPKQFLLDKVSDRVRKAMRMVGLDFDDLKDRRLETLSGGEKRKVALASTLILDQEILLFDEPTAGMDPRAREEILALFCQLRDQQKTIVIASHRLEELAMITQDLSVMQSGKIVQTGSSRVIFSNPQMIIDAGLDPPLAVAVSKKLIDNGWPINDKDTTTPDRLTRVLQEMVI